MTDQPRDAGAGGWGQRWPDWLNLILGAWLFISPWVLGLVSPASWNNWIVGIVVAILALWAAGQRGRWQEWCNLVLGAWTFITPWVYGFAAGSGAAWNGWIVGVLVFIVSAFGVGLTRSAAHATQSR